MWYAGSKKTIIGTFPHSLKHQSTTLIEGCSIPASIDATLGRPGFGTGVKNVDNSQQTTVISPQINMHPITINGNPSDTTIQLVQHAAQKGSKEGYQRVVEDLAKGEGDAHKALTGGYKIGRKIG